MNPKRTKKPIFVVHPVTRDQKREILSDNPGSFIVDARFAPDGAKVIELNPEKPEKAKKTAKKTAKKADEKTVDE